MNGSHAQYGVVAAGPAAPPYQNSVKSMNYGTGREWPGGSSVGLLTSGVAARPRKTYDGAFSERKGKAGGRAGSAVHGTIVYNYAFATRVVHPYNRE